MILEEEHYIRSIEEDYKLLNQSLNNDIDKQINNNINEINTNFLDKEKIKLIKKENKLADYILGNDISPPTPIKCNIKNNPLSHSFSKVRIPTLMPMAVSYDNFKNKTINLEDFFNKDEQKKENKNNGINIKESLQIKEAQDKIDQDYASIFKDLKRVREYTKKYSKKDDEENLETSTTSFYSSNTNKKRNKDNKQKYSNNASPLNSSISFSNFEKEAYGSKKEYNINNDKISDDKNDENSERTIGLKNISRTVLDKELINIQENKEDEEDEEDDEQNHKNKEEMNKNEIEENKENKENNNHKNNNEEEVEEEVEEEEVKG